MLFNLIRTAPTTINNKVNCLELYIRVVVFVSTMWVL